MSGNVFRIILSIWTDVQIFPFLNLVSYLRFCSYEVLIFFFYLLVMPSSEIHNNHNFWQASKYSAQLCARESSHQNKPGFQKYKEGFFFLHLVSGFRTPLLHPGITGLGPIFSCCLSSSVLAMKTWMYFEESRNK